jgi:hypothetical protein
MTRGYRSWFQDLKNVWTVPVTMLKNKVIYRQFIHSVAFVNLKCCTCLRPLYLYFPDTPRICNIVIRISSPYIHTSVRSDVPLKVLDHLGAL